ncbi:MAG: phosphate/phosphite/phosphonate ABC transporter substrate-binding protein [Chloroflexi bacterium]|nr:phosphate/phosphite/phosphonate ABC transporter substrate-binding protein [Chloroflexota bacterium]
MSQKRLTRLIVALLALTTLLIACQPQTVEVTRIVTETVTEEVEVPVEVEVEVPVEVTRVVTETVVETVVETVTEEVMVEEADLGSEDRPIQVLFVPSVDADAIVSGGEALAAELNAVTGLNFEVSVPTSYAATIESMCASPDDTIAFIPALGYVLANERCGVQVGLASVRFGWPVYWAQIVVRDDSGIESLEDLAGKTWGAPSVTSTSGFLVPSAMLTDAGIETGEVVETGGHTNAMLAVAQGDVDFATSFFSPPLLPNYDRWNPTADDPEIWRDADVAPERTEAGRVFVAGGPDEGGYRVLDARSSAMETYPAIFDETHILTISDEIPNDTLSYGAEFPLALAQDISEAVSAYAGSDACQEPPEGTVTLCSDAFYNWTGADQVLDSAFDPTRFLINALGMTEEDVLGE